MLKPTQDYILVKPIERKQSSVLQVIHSEKHCRGEVIAVGPGKRDKRGNIKPMDTKVGDIIAFGDGNFDFYPFYKVDNPDGTSTTYRIIQEADICFVDDGVGVGDVAVAA